MSDAKPKRRIVSFADIAARAPAAIKEPKKEEPPAAELKRVTYADLVALSKRPEDFAEAEAEVAPQEATGIPVSPTPDKGAPTSSQIDIGTPEVGRPPQGLPYRSAPEAGSSRKLGIPELGVPGIGIPQPGIPHNGALAPSAASRGFRQIHQAVLAQDGHSLGEQAVYNALWNNAQPHNDEGRIISIGYRPLSRVCGLTVNNCKANLRGLVRKLAIAEESGYTHATSRTYLVYSFGAILKRRRAAGLTHYIRTKGVVFVDPISGAEINGGGPCSVPRGPSNSGIPGQATPEAITGVPQGGAPEAARGAPGGGASGTPFSAPLIDLEIYTRNSSSEIEEVAAVLSGQGITADDDAVRRLLAASRSQAGDATLAEICLFIRQKCALMRRMPNLENPVGFLQVAVPKCFEGESFRQFRQTAARRERLQEEQGALARAEAARLEAEQQAILRDAASTEEDKRFARMYLGINDKGVPG